MDVILNTPALPVALLEGYSRSEEASIIVQCHDRTFKSVTILDGVTSQKLFKVESKGATSLSLRRTVIDASSDRRLFDLRHQGYTLKNLWTVETPNGQIICSLKHADWRARSALTATVHENIAHGGSKDVVVEMQPKDRSAITTLVNIQGVTVAEIRNIEDNDVVNLEGVDRTVWKTRIAKGVDVSLVSLVSIEADLLC